MPNEPQEFVSISLSVVQTCNIHDCFQLQGWAVKVKKYWQNVGGKILQIKKKSHQRGDPAESDGAI